MYIYIYIYIYTLSKCRSTACALCRNHCNIHGNIIYICLYNIFFSTCVLYSFGNTCSSYVASGIVIIGSIILGQHLMLR